jgi:hypothetical protein
MKDTNQSNQIKMHIDQNRLLQTCLGPKITV